jgi:hypothetical protein
MEKLCGFFLRSHEINRNAAAIDYRNAAGAGRGTRRMGANARESAASPNVRIQKGIGKGRWRKDSMFTLSIMPSRP